MIDIDAVKAVLGSKYREDGNYAVCGFGQQPFMLSRGYKEVGRIQDPSDYDREMLIFDRAPQLEKERKMGAEEKDKLSKAQAKHRQTQERSKPNLKPRARPDFVRSQNP